MEHSLGMSLDVQWVLEHLHILKKFDPKGKLVFGAELHRNTLNSPLSEAQVIAFEQNHGISLPEDYRTFLTQIGNGGVGPGYGLYRLEDWNEPGWASEYIEPNVFLKTPFPHTKAWDPIKEADPHNNWRLEVTNGLPDEILPSEVNRIMDQAYKDFFNRVSGDDYFSPSHVTGAIIICHWGCGWEDSLVVSGPMRGTIWKDARGFDSGIYPHVKDFDDPESKPLTFQNGTVCG